MIGKNKQAHVAVRDLACHRVPEAQNHHQPCNWQHIKMIARALRSYGVLTARVDMHIYHSNFVPNKSAQ